MKKLKLKGSWYINAPRERIYNIISDFEAMPKNFPGVAETLKIVSRKGNKLIIHGLAKGLGRKVKVKMNTELLPGIGFRSVNNSDIVKDGHEEFLLSDEGKGTRITYKYEITVKNPLLRFLAKPVIGGFSMWRWKRLVIDKLKQMTED